MLFPILHGFILFVTDVEVPSRRHFLTQILTSNQSNASQCHSVLSIPKVFFQFPSPPHDYGNISSAPTSPLSAPTSPSSGRRSRYQRSRLLFLVGGGSIVIIIMATASDSSLSAQPAVIVRNPNVDC